MSCFILFSCRYIEFKGRSKVICDVVNYTGKSLPVNCQKQSYDDDDNNNKTQVFVCKLLFPWLRLKSNFVIVAPLG